MAITPDGVIYIKQYLAGIEDTIAEGIAYGISGEAVRNKALGFHMDIADIQIISYDFINDRIVCKGSLPDDLEAVIYEVGLVARVAAMPSSVIISTFDSETENWNGGTWQTQFTRIGGDSLRFSPTTSTTVSSTLDGIAIDLSMNAPSDQFVIAYNNLNANTGSIKFEFHVDDTNYYTATVTSPATGYVISRMTKSSVTATGSPTWSNITYITAKVTATSGGNAQVDIDGLRIESVSGVNPDYLLVAREVLSTPFVKGQGKNEDVEFSLGVTIG